MTAIASAPARGGAWVRGLFLVLGLVVGGHAPAQAAEPLFTFAQISDSQPQTPEQQARFEQVLDTIAAAGSTGALIPRAIDFVLFPGDLVSHADTQSEWISFVNAIDARLTANGIPYRAVPGNHDQDGFGVGFYEFYVGDSGVWSSDSATIVGQNGPTVNTGWSGLRFIGFNNSNGAWNQISPSDAAAISARVSEAAAAGENAFLLGHHPHDGQEVIPLAAVLENPAICCYARGHSGSPGARRGLASVVNPNAWDLNSNSIVDDGALLYYEVYATELRVHAIELVLAPTALPAPKTVPLPYALHPAVPLPPTAAFSATPSAGSAPLAVDFTDLSSGSPTAWSWSFGDGATSSEQHPTHTYTAPGVYDVSLTASNAGGADTELRAGLVACAPPPPAETFLPVADARVKSSSPTSNYGTDDALRVRAGDPTYTSYLRFDVTGLEGAVAIGAKLRLFASDASDDGGALYEVAGGWTESGITWGNAPAIGGAPVAPGGAIVAGAWREIEVGAVVRGEGSYAFGLASASTDSAYYSSREGANPPELVVQTGPPSVPVADFAAAPTQGAAPLAVAFTDLSTGGPTFWSWSFGDGATSTARNPSHTYAAAGVYDVTLQVANALGSDSVARSAAVAVAAPAPPQADFSGAPLAGEAPLAVAFSDLSTGAPTSWLWSFGDGSTSTEPSPSHTYATPGRYDVSLEVANAAGADAQVRSGYVDVAPGVPRRTFEPAADARVSSSSPNGNYGSDVALRARGGSTVYRSFLRFDVSGLGGVGVVSARLRLFVTDGSDSAGSVYRVANAWSEGTITDANAPAIDGPPLASAGAAVVGQWVEYDVTPAVGGEGSVSFAIASASSNSVYFSSREGGVPPQLVLETGAAVAPVADFAGAPLQGPAPLPVVFEDFSTGGPTSWLWSFGDGTTASERSPSHVYASPGRYDVGLTVANAEGSDSLVRTAYVDVSAPLPVATFAPAADAKVNSARPDVNYGGEPNLRLRAASTGVWRSFLRFDVAGLGAPVARATLRLRVDDGSRDGGALHLVSGAWSESGLTWNTAPSLDGAPIATLGRVTTDTWVEIDVTSTVVGDGAYAFGLGSASSDTAYYASRESANAPQLVIELAR